MLSGLSIFIYGCFHPLLNLPKTLLLYHFEQNFNIFNRLIMISLWGSTLGRIPLRVRTLGRIPLWGSNRIALWGRSSLWIPLWKWSTLWVTWSSSLRITLWRGSSKLWLVVPLHWVGRCLSSVQGSLAEQGGSDRQRGCNHLALVFRAGMIWTCLLGQLGL